MDRRGFLKALVAPAIILTPGLLMPVRSFGSALQFIQSGFTQLSYAAILHGDGIRDDSAALEAFLNGLPVMYQGRVVQDHLGFGNFLISRQIDITVPSRTVLTDSTITARLQPNEACLMYHNSSIPEGEQFFPVHRSVFNRFER